LVLTTSSARTRKQDIPVPDRGLDALDELLVLLVRGEGTRTDSPDDVVVVDGLFLRSRDKGVDWMVERFRDALREETIQEKKKRMRDMTVMTREGEKGSPRKGRTLRRSSAMFSI